MWYEDLVKHWSLKTKKLFIGDVDGDIVVGLVIHEVVQITVSIAVGDVLALDERLGELCGGVVAGLHHRAGDDVLGLGADKGRALAGLHVLELNDLKNLAVLLKGHAIAKLACRNHRNSSINLKSQMPAPATGGELSCRPQALVHIFIYFTQSRTVWQGV